ncbi:sugar phosphate isomerase/epimerase family protein [Levilactobacillus brevis]|uniref:sugar phosphate isomerase/epimerase family protein n=1 Tax=Levilactobacillus brevis TaxID=1580 RepID=UPI002072BA5C|nr:sugar phosphate isomerase/epimerase [Levilactobacillus brevis]
MTSLRLGIRAHDLPATSLTELLKQAEQYPFTHLHFAPAKLAQIGLGSDLTPGLANYLHQQLQSHGLTVSILGCYVNIVHPNPQIREKNLQHFEDYLSLARWFNNPIVATETGSVSEDGYSEANFSKAAFDQVVASVRRLANTAEKLGTVFAIEPGMNHPICTLEKTRRLFNLVDSPNMKIICDPVNLITTENYRQQKQLIDEFLEDFGERIITFHLKDFTIRHHRCDVVSFGQGQFAREYFIKAIIARFPHTFCTFEGIQPQDISPAIAELRRYVNIDLV